MWKHGTVSCARNFARWFTVPGTQRAQCRVIVGTHQRDGYRVENVMFQSRPNFWVTGNPYVPLKGTAPFLGVISPCSHYPLSRMKPEYQAVYINMVKAGFVVLAYDPVGQGERSSRPNKG